MIPAVLQYPRIEPYLFRLGDSGLSWYVFIYLMGFVIGYFILRGLYRRGELRLKQPSDVSLLVLYCFYGVVLGARIFYVVFYHPSFYLQYPWEIPAIWHGGLSFHGGLAGAFLAVWIFCRRNHAPLLQVTDALGLCVPVALGLGRIANFIHGELYGRPSNVPWAMVFPDGGPEPRHPSQLYEAVLEGPVLFLLMYGTWRWKSKDGMVTAVGMIAYGALRFVAEFFREPDEQLGTLLGPFSLGQLFCAAMLLAGLILASYIKRTSPGER